MISFRQLRYFDALVRHRHFGRAAEHCSVTQPALSMQIKELEQTLGVRLVERRGSAITITEEGREVARRSEGILASVADLTDFARHRKKPLTGQLRLGIIPSIAPYLLPDTLPVLQQRFPELDLQVRETQTNALVDELIGGELDVIVAALPMAHAQIDTMPLFDDEFLVAVASSDAAAWQGADVRQRLTQQRVLLLEEGHCLRDQALQFCSLPSGTARRTLGATSLTTIIQMVAAGYGVTLLPKLCAGIEVRDARITLLRFGEDVPRRTIGLAWRRTSPRKRDYLALGQTILATRAVGEGGALPGDPGAGSA